MDLNFLGFIILLGMFVVFSAMSFVRNFYGLIKLEKPTKAQISYNENIAALTLVLFMLWLVLLQISMK